MKRKIIKIDESVCDGCGLCIPNCAEGALQIIDNKARLISDLFCDGLGACIGFCPKDAISIEEREAEPYNEEKVMDFIIQGGKNVIIAHLKHLYEHNELIYLEQAINYLEELNIVIPSHLYIGENKAFAGCPGSRTIDLVEEKENDRTSEKGSSQLTNWPIQLHLINPSAGNFGNANVLLAADCTAFSIGNFHDDYLKGKSLLIACPKLDSGKDIYLNKLITLIKDTNINSLTVMIMEVPCCRGLLQLVQQAINLSGKTIPLRLFMVGIRGEILMEEDL
jgi:NAD-dependent dihydropyrimidine dehydrogenase PreA subunit